MGLLPPELIRLVEAVLVQLLFVGEWEGDGESASNKTHAVMTIPSPQLRPLVRTLYCAMRWTGAMGLKVVCS